MMISMKSRNYAKTNEPMRNESLVLSMKILIDFDYSMTTSTNMRRWVFGVGL